MLSKFKLNNDKINNKFNKEELHNIKNITNFVKHNCPELYGKIENYEFLDSGGESNVYKINFKNRNTLIMKLVLNTKRQKKNISEIIISNKLKHKNVINFIGYYPSKNNESDLVLMEQGHFGSLRNFLNKILKRDTFSQTILCYLTYQILNGLKYCQKNKIVHYDIKPDNIIIDNMLNIKLIDFSISLDYSKIKDDEIQLDFGGTNFYISPEVLKRKFIKLKDINKIDIYSLGIFLYRFAFGYYPFELQKDDANNYDIIYEKVINNNLEFNNEDNYYSDYFIEFIKKLLEKDINKRISIEEALNDYWVKGAQILIEEKEKMYNINSFLINLITDGFYNFNFYLKKDRK